jgi:mono/diheme cytochrome c family protein
VPHEELWAGSAHADASAEAFRHWDEDDPKEVPTNCARCHTPTGYQDYLGATVQPLALWMP